MIWLINLSVTSPIFSFFFLKTFMFCSLSKCQWYNVINYIVTMLYSRSLDLIHLVAESLYPFTNLYFSYHPPQPENHFLFSVSMSLTFFFLIPYIIPCGIYLSLVYFTSCNVLRIHPLSQMVEYLSSSWLNNIPLCVCVCMCVCVCVCVYSHRFYRLFH